MTVLGMCDVPSERKVLMVVMVRLRSRSPSSRLTQTLLEPPPGLHASVRTPNASAVSVSASKT